MLNQNWLLSFLIYTLQNGKIFCDKSLGLAKGLSSAWDQPGIGLLRREGPKHGIKNQGSTHH